MENLLQNKILKNISNSQNKCYIISDFLHLGNHEAVKKVLQRLEKDKTIRRLIRGIYDKPEYNEKFKSFSAPDINEAAKALARQFNWNICPSGNYALNLLGISTQIPAKYVYISDGPYKTYKIEGTEIEFKHSNKKEISDFSYKTLIVIQALKTIGRENVNENIIKQIRKGLSKQEMNILFVEGQKTSIWIYEIIKKICEDINV